MITKVNQKPLDHNIGTHSEKMKKRRAVQSNRVTTYRKIKTGKYTPSEEDRKHADP